MREPVYLVGGPAAGQTWTWDIGAAGDTFQVPDDLGRRRVNFDPELPSAPETVHITLYRIVEFQVGPPPHWRPMLYACPVDWIGEGPDRYSRNAARIMAELWKGYRKHVDLGR